MAYFVLALWLVGEFQCVEFTLWPPQFGENMSDCKREKIKRHGGL